MAFSDRRNDWLLWLAQRGRELETAIAFSTRLPLARSVPISGGAVAQAAWALPVAGLLVGAAGALVYALAQKIGLPAWPAAALAVAATLAVTGCLHEDGLADTADGFGGGKTREQKLAIMRDSRIGTYGVCTLSISLLLRVSALASFIAPDQAVLALIAAHSGARASMLPLMFAVPPARRDGLSFEAGQPPFAGVAAALGIGFLALLFCLGLGSAVVATIALAIVVTIVARLCLRQIDGQSGDVIGALEQVSEIVILLIALS